MNEKGKEVLEKVKAFFKKMSKRTRIILGASLGALIIALVVVIALLSHTTYSVLFTGLSGEEANAIVTYLNENGYSDYQIKNADTILVPEEQETLLKAKLLMEGYPKSGFGYTTYFSNVSALSTESERNTAFLFDLQDRMSAVIRCFDGVKEAVVTISQGEDRRYVLDSSNIVSAGASIYVTMEYNRTLTNQQASAIRSLVTHAVKGLEIENVEISDALGNTYSAGDSAASEQASELKLRLEEQVNNSVRTSIMAVLTPLFGEENVRVSVKSTVDLARVTGDSVSYTEPEWAADGSTGGRGIIGSRVYSYEAVRDEGDTVSGVVGTETNSDISTYVEETMPLDGSETAVSISGQTDYNVDTLREQTVRSAGVVTDLMVSVSINSTTAGNSVNTPGLITHVARAAGISEVDQAGKISILALPFYDPADNPIVDIIDQGLPTWALYAAIAGFVLLLAILITILLTSKKRRLRRALEAQRAADEMEALLRQQAEESEKKNPFNMDVMNLKSERSLELRRSIRQFAEESPEIAAQMIRNWLKGEDGNA